MLEYTERLFAEYRSKGLLIDTNLLLLYLVGLLDPQRITSFKRTNTYTTEDFELLDRVVQQFDIVITTPHVLTEVSNLAAQLPRHLHNDCFVVLAAMIPELTEKHTPAAEVREHPAFRQSFGLTDAAIADAAAESHLVLTDDLPLYHYLANTSGNAVNFNHLRSLNW